MDNKELQNKDCKLCDNCLGISEHLTLIAIIKIGEKQGRKGEAEIRDEQEIADYINKNLLYLNEQQIHYHLFNYFYARI